MNSKRVKRIFRNSIKAKEALVKAQGERIVAVARAIVSSYRSGNKVIAFGNGGSAADSQHICAELLGRFKINRRPLAAIALNCNTSALTAIANDFGFEETFAKQLEALGNAGDVAIGISTSGNSPNVLKALKLAKSMGLLTVAFTGYGGGKLKEIADIALVVPSNDTPRVQESHITMGHAICELVEEELFKKAGTRGPQVIKEGTEYLAVNKKIKTLPELKRIIASLKKKGKVVVFTNGCFDILHYGHAAYLLKAKALGDILVVAVNSDSSVRRIKGSGRPINTQMDRVRLLCALACVDYVTIFSRRTPISVIKAISPDILVKGGDWKKDDIVGGALVSSRGGRVISLPYINGYSTTSTLRAIRKCARSV